MSKDKILAHRGTYTYFRYTVKGPLTGGYSTEYTGSHHSVHQLSARTIAKRLRDTWRGHIISNVVVTHSMPSGYVVYAGDK